MAKKRNDMKEITMKSNQFDHKTTMRTLQFSTNSKEFIWMFHSIHFALGAIEKYSSVKNTYKWAEFETIKIMPANHLVNPYPTQKPVLIRIRVLLSIRSKFTQNPRSLTKQTGINKISSMWIVHAFFFPLNHSFLWHFTSFMKKESWS